MAQPIPLIQPQRDPKQELLARLDAAPVEYAAALLDSYELLQQLHECGAFTLIRGALGATDKMVEAVASGASSEEAIRAMRNAVILAKTLGAIDPELLRGLSDAVNKTLGDAKSIPPKPPSLFSLLVSLAGKDSRRGLSMISTLFRNLGARLKPGNDSTAARQ